MDEIHPFCFIHGMSQDIYENLMDAQRGLIMLYRNLDPTLEGLILKERFAKLILPAVVF